MNRPEADVIETFQNIGLIKRNKRCPKRNCRQYCQLWQRPHFKLHHAFVCRKCKTEYGVLAESYFENIHVSIKHLLYIIWLWVTDCNSGTASCILNIPRNTIYQQYRFLRDICSWKLLNIPQIKLGGPNIIVQIDESIIAKRKYHRGRLIREKWVLGMYDTSTRKGMIMYIPNRSSETLQQKIVQFVKPGTEIWTDCWRGYKDLDKIGNVSQFLHKTVNHSRYFVDPATNTCTNMVESYWAKLKKYMRKLGVMNSKFWPEYVDQFMYKEHFGGTCQEQFNNVLRNISEKYPV